jgi:threonylcarbamoyladenosine tRNA methylthiotransferase CDKAL1
MKKVYVRSNGCIDNLLDGKSFRNYFKDNGWEVVQNPAEADIILANTCAYDKEHEDSSVKDINELKKFKNAQLVVTGCLPKINSDRMKEVFDGISFGPKERNKIKEIIGSDKEIAWKDQHTISDDDISVMPHRKIVHNVKKLKSIAGKYGKNILPNFEIGDLTGDQDSYFLVLGEGCLGNCSYCAIKKAKGMLKSVPVDDLIKDFKQGLADGHKRFILTADDTGAYGQDIGTDLPTLIEKLLKVKGDYKLNIYHLEPNWLIKYSDYFKKVFKTSKIDVIFSPVQSGSDKILKAMRRPYKARDYIKCIKDLRNELPSLKIWNQFIIGFPGETEEDFVDCMKMLDEVSFNVVQAFAYSDRPGTPASKMADHVPEDIIKKRLKRMNRKIFLKVNLKKLKPVGKSAS